MCGITGFISPDTRESKKRTIAAMTATLKHRGPDAWGRYVTADVALGHSRLSIIDLAAGHQPMQTERSAIAFNGEIFNYIELRRELTATGARFVTDSDTEVALRALEAWGPGAFAKFNGQFAILFWDKQRRELLAGRDHYGIRPLFYVHTPGKVFFASEMKALDASGEVKRTWSPAALLTHGLLWNTLGSDTVFEGVKSLPPGSWALFSRDAELVRSGAYYRLGEHQPEVPETYAEAQQIFQNLLETSVDLQLRSDVPVGCYLSGGIDSSVTSYLAKKVKGDRFKSFSVAFADDAYDESVYQRMMVDQLGSEHFTETITKDDIDAHFLDAARHFERPVFRTAPVPLYRLSERVRKENVKVVLTGEGADEILCGYDVFKEVKLLEAWENGASDDEINQVLGILYPHLDHYSAEGNTGLMKMYYEGFLGKSGGPWAGLAIRLHNNRILGKYLNKDWNVEVTDEQIEAGLRADLPDYVLDWPVLKRNQYLEMKTLLEGYLLSSQGDRMAMAHSVEGRYPFLDPNLVEWAFALPLDWKLNGWQQKFLLKDTYGPVLPDAITNRPKRPYLAPDLEAFLRNGVPTETARRFLGPKAIADYGLFDPKMVERLLFKYERRGNEGIGYRDNMLVSFILSTQMAEYWLRHPLMDSLDPKLCTVDVEE